MRPITFGALACVLLATCGCSGLQSVASAGTVGPSTLKAAPPTITESDQPPGVTGVALTDNPAIVNSSPLQFDSWSRAAVADAVTLHFTIGSPACTGVHATVEETAQTVTVALQSGTLPEATGRMCVMIAVSATLDVPLQSSLGDRTVLSAY